MYVLITAARNEECCIEATIRSVAAQTVLPRKWVIVSDSSTDRTDEIVSRFAGRYSWIALLRTQSGQPHSFVNKARAVGMAYSSIQNTAFDVVGVVDADTTFAPDYFEFLLHKLESDPQLGVVGTPFEESDYHSLHDSCCDSQHVHGGCQLFRRRCFEEIGGYVPLELGAEDWLAVRMANMKGWKTKSYPERTFFHHRRMGTAQSSVWKSRFRAGQKDGMCGNHPLWQMFRVLYQLFKKPRLIGGLLILAGYLEAAFRRRRRAIPPEVIRCNRARQMQRLRHLAGHPIRTIRSGASSQRPPKPHLAAIVYSHYPRDPRVRRQVKALTGDGWAIDVFCLRAIEEPRRTLNGDVSIYRIMRDFKKDSVLRYILLTGMFTIRALFTMEWLNLTRRYRLIQVHNMPDYLVFAAAFRRMRGVPVLLDIHDTTVELFKCKWGSGPKALLIPCVRFIEKLSCGLANQVTTTSPGFRKQLIHRGLPVGKVSVIVNTPPADEFSLDRNRQFGAITRGARLFYHGTVAERFGILTAIEALKEILKYLPDSTLTICGKYEGPFRRHLEGYLRAMELEDHVLLRGWCMPSEIARLLQKHDIALVPHLNSEFMNLAILTKVLEYATVGMPMVLSRLEALTSLFGDDRLQYAEPGNAKDLADKVMDVCKDPDLRRIQCMHAYEVLNAISPDAESLKYAATVRRLVGDSRHCAMGPMYAEP